MADEERKHVQVCVCMFKRKPGEIGAPKSEGWERGIAFVAGGDVQNIFDSDGKALGSRNGPYDFTLLPNDGSFSTELW